MAQAVTANRRVGTGAPPPGYVRLDCDDPPLAATILLGSGAVRLLPGDAGWETVARPQQTAMTIWNGGPALGVELPLMLDGWADQRSQEPALRKLLAVWGGDDESPPGIVQVTGVPLPRDRWVIENLELADGEIRRADGALVRQPLTLTLREYVPPTYLQLRKRALQGAKGKTKTITVRKGDTPAIIARRQKCSWTDLRDLNVGVVTKANQNLKDGSKLRVPVAASRDRRAAGSARSRKGATSRRSD